MAPADPSPIPHERHAADRYADDLALALTAADVADAITLPRFLATDLAVRAKADATEVTDADLAAERAVRDLLAARRPDDAVLGEEHGSTGAGARQWVVDPIDGTRNFLRGVPVWATLVALLQDGDPVVGVVSAPALGRRWWAARGAGAWTLDVGATTPRPCRVSGVDDLGAASLSHSSVTSWRGAPGGLEGFLGLCDQVWRTRAYGDFWSYCLVAEGAVDIAAEPEVSLWDLAALAVLVGEAGGRFTSLSGEPGPAGGDAVATNGRLHDAVLAHLGTASGRPAPQQG
jgi:histidinol-phosphatase